MEKMNLKTGKQKNKWKNASKKSGLHQLKKEMKFWAEMQDRHKLYHKWIDSDFLPYPTK